MLKRLALILLLLCLSAIPAQAQLGSVPQVFVPGTTISSTAVNTDFTTAYNLALNRTGGTMSGTLTSQTLLPATTATYNLGSSGAQYLNGWVSGTLTVGTLTATTISSVSALTVTTLTLTTLTCTGCVTATNLAATAVTPGSYGAGAPLAIPTFTVDANGRLTAASTVNATLPMLINYIPGVCQNAVASLGFNTPASNPAATSCFVGTNTLFATADFAASSNLSVQGNFQLPFDWSGAVDVRVKWFSATTSGNVVWQFATACVAAGATPDPSFNTASTVTSAAQGTTLQEQDATISSATVTGCTAGSQLYWKLSRNAGTGSDTMAGTARLTSALITVRRTITSS